MCREVFLCSVLGLDNRFALTLTLHAHTVVVQVGSKPNNRCALSLPLPGIAPQLVSSSLCKLRRTWFRREHLWGDSFWPIYVELAYGSRGAHEKPKESYDNPSR
jgi:hypothetical protein